MDYFKDESDLEATDLSQKAVFRGQKEGDQEG